MPNFNKFATKFSKFSNAGFAPNTKTPGNIDEEGKTPHPNEACEQELSEAAKAFKQRSLTEQARFERSTDSEFWFAVCAQTRDEKEAFLKAIGLPIDTKYLDIAELAKALGVTFKQDNSGFAKTRFDKSFTHLT